MDPTGDGSGRATLATGRLGMAIGVGVGAAVVAEDAGPTAVFLGGGTGPPRGSGEVGNLAAMAPAGEGRGETLGGSVGGRGDVELDVRGGKPKLAAAVVVVVVVDMKLEMVVLPVVAMVSKPGGGAGRAFEKRDLPGVAAVFSVPVEASIISAE